MRPHGRQGIDDPRTGQHSNAQNTMNYTAAIRIGDGGPRRWAVLQIKTSTWYFPTIPGRIAAERMAADLNRLDPDRDPLPMRKYHCYYLTSKWTTEARSDHEAGVKAAQRWNTTPMAVKILQAH